MPQVVSDASRDANVPKRFRDASLSHMMADIDQGTKDLLMDYTIHMPEGAGLILTGSTGTGKTYIACAIINERIRIFSDVQEETPYFFNVNRDLPQLLDFRMFRKRDPYHSTMRKLTNASLLVVDDLMHTPNVEFATDIIYRIYESRYADMLPTITTTNVRLEGEDLDLALLQQLSRRFNEPFVRRLTETAYATILT